MVIIGLHKIFVTVRKFIFFKGVFMNYITVKGFIWDLSFVESNISQSTIYIPKFKQPPYSGTVNIVIHSKTVSNTCS